MKVRSDFVTNSSSSSFIIGYNSQIGIEPDIRAQISSHIYSEYLINFLIDDINTSVAYDKETLKNLVYDEVTHFGLYTTKEKDTVINTQTDFILAVAEEKGYDRFVIVSYGDDDGEFFCCLEHKIVPDLENTLQVYSHH